MHMRNILIVVLKSAMRLINVKQMFRKQETGESVAVEQNSVNHSISFSSGFA